MKYQEGIYEELVRRKSAGIKSLAVLLDPDELSEDSLQYKIEKIHKLKVDFIFFGGSLVHNDKANLLIRKIKQYTDTPVVIFPGSNTQIYPDADAILLLNLISGRNSDFLIGQHVTAAYILQESQLEILSTSYLLVDSGTSTTASYISNTTPIPHNKPEIASATALAGQQIGHKLTFMDGGSGALEPISDRMVEKVAKTITNPLIIGGGIRSAEKISRVLAAGADLVVIGNALEENFEILEKLVQASHYSNNIRFS